MSQASTTPTAPPPSRNVLVTLFGVLTLLWGFALILAFVGLYVATDRVFEIMNVVIKMEEKATEKEGVKKDVTEKAEQKVNEGLATIKAYLAVVAGIGGAFGLIGFIGGIGMTFRIGRVLAFLFALIHAGLGGLALFGGVKANVPYSDPYMIVAITFLAYGVLTLLLLLFSGGEFVRERGAVA